MKPIMSYEELPPLVKRRLNFVFTELYSLDAKYDQAMSLLLRVLSNFATVGSDGGSFAIKQLNPRMSVSAKLLREKLQDDKRWASETINEHPMPLKNMWKSWRSEGGSLTEKKIWEDLVIHPMVTITKEEDAKLRDAEKHTPDYVPHKRYEYASIELIPFS